MMKYKQNSRALIGPHSLWGFTSDTWILNYEWLFLLRKPRRSIIWGNHYTKLCGNIFMFDVFCARKYIMSRTSILLFGKVFYNLFRLKKETNKNQSRSHKKLRSKTLLDCTDLIIFLHPRLFDRVRERGNEFRAMNVNANKLRIDSSL